jgi:GDP-L-fucose synthase
MERTLVTGANGLVGAALVRHLKQAGDDVIALESRAQCDLLSEAETHAVFKFVRPTKVYHLAAAVFGVGGNSAFPGEVFYRNSMINLNVIEAARSVGVTKFLAMGSAAIYADGLSQPMNEEDALTGVPHASEFAYAYSKRAMLAQLRAYKQQYGMEYMFVIATNMYGPGDRFDPKYGHVVPSLLKKFLDAETSGDRVEIWGDGTPTRDFLYSADAASGLHAIMEKGTDVVNLASGNSVTIADLVREVALQFPGVEYDWNIERPLGQLSRSYDVGRLNALGFKPKFSLAEGIAETAKWLRANAQDIRS